MNFKYDEHKTSEVSKTSEVCYRNKMEKYIFSLIIIFNYSILSQAIKIEISNLTQPAVKLYAINGEQFTFIYSLKSS
jgi:hypothetical protein